MNTKTALITGASTGIGFELAKLFAQDKYRLIVVARNKSELDQAASQLQQISGQDVIAIEKDLFEPNSAFELYEEIKSKGISVDILINNAGQGQYGEFSESDLSRQLDIIQLNISSLVSLTYLYLQDFTAQASGKILNTSSVASKSPGPWQAVYHATKAFVQSFTEAVRSEVKDKGITVTALLPGATDTDFFNKAEMNASKIVQDKDKLADPADVAKDGYKALMANDDMVVSGLKNKIQTSLGAITPEERLADSTGKSQEPVNQKKVGTR